MLEDVLGIRCTELELAQQLHHLGRHADDARFLERLLAGLFNLLIDFTASLFDHLLDAAGVNATVRQQFLQSHTSHLAPNRVEAG